jgi:hypothetical protein
MATIDERKWRPWHSIGLFNGHRGKIQPWTLIDVVAQIYAGNGEACYAFGNVCWDTFYKADVDRWAHPLIVISWIGSLFLFGIGVPCVVFWMCSRSSGDYVLEKEEATSLEKDKDV